MMQAGNRELTGRPVLRNVEVSAHIVERAAILRFLRFFVSVMLTGFVSSCLRFTVFFTGRRSSAVCRFPDLNADPDSTYRRRALGARRAQTANRNYQKTNQIETGIT